MYTAKNILYKHGYNKCTHRIIPNRSKYFDAAPVRCIVTSQLV